MYDIIIEYRENVPKSPISELHEMFPRKLKYRKTEKLRPEKHVKGEREKFRVTVEIEGIGCYKGIGTTEKIAKTTAAKLALYKIKLSSKIYIGEKGHKKDQAKSKGTNQPNEGKLITNIHQKIDNIKHFVGKIICKIEQRILHIIFVTAKMWQTEKWIVTQ